ncbi:unnamed protein product [Euphydryas editha]|uniref:Protein SERAC1 n=1 Tax=Euphydryas editha TaxID=104508 RepID=A0AAU9UQP4_EUPED|nr:unnamed protein product [Euphydryas editha]
MSTWAPKPTKTRPASSDHLHPEPKVECVVLHSPAEPTVDVIFIHGLYGSLGNTWRQGEWTSKYSKLPTKVPLRRPHSVPTCKCTTEKSNCLENTSEHCKTDRDEMKIYENVQKVFTQDSYFTAEKFYNNTVMENIDMSSYETQAQFVKDMFENNARETKSSDCKCIDNECNGCGCVCDECYSPCWPRDWIKVDHPGARVISINYTSDPYLWRPLWIREIKRLRLYDRAEQMISQLLELGVGERPIIWVGHSKGGLFIKQIYCEAHEARMKITEPYRNTGDSTQNTSECKNDNLINHSIDKQTHGHGNNCDTICDNITDDIMNNSNNNNALNSDNLNNNQIINNNSDSENQCELNENEVGDEENPEANETQLTKRARLYTNSAGFMFYSVPHRGSPLADIKTPITARSVELMEICKDCSLVLTLQERWLRAVSSPQPPPPPAVRSLVETCRTLMSVLYLRIVSVDSADPGIGALFGVSVDHREICKPSSRKCLLYRELMTLMDDALNRQNKTDNKNCCQ